MDAVPQNLSVRCHITATVQKPLMNSTCLVFSSDDQRKTVNGSQVESYFF